MKKNINFTALTFWFIVNSVLTICLGLFLAVTCLIPSFAPAVRTLLFNENIAPLLPYIIFSLIVSSLVLISFYVDSRWR
ncbi:MAG: hypothetical protein HXX11_07805 [Desulfuromonadales bacterium]|nr:hypothetical protein [Desulfuromonadales bacterium]